MISSNDKLAIGEADPQNRPKDQTDILIIGCGNLLRGDDAAGPICVRRLWDAGLPAGVLCADGGTGGMDVAFQMRNVPHVILVDACRSGTAPGAIFEVPGKEVENLPPLSGINLHAFRWDHALAFGRWLLKDKYPQRVTVLLIEGRDFAVGEELSPPVDAAVDQLVQRLLLTDFLRQPATNSKTPSTLSAQHGPDEHTKLGDRQIQLTGDGYLRMSATMALRYFPHDSLIVHFSDGRLSLLPTRGPSAGGLLLKQYKPEGHRCVLVSEIVPNGLAGTWDTEWDTEAGALRANAVGTSM